MKKYLFLIGFIILFNNLFSQVKFSSYFNSFIQERYNVEIGFDEADQKKYTLYVDAWCLDNFCSEAGIMINEKQHNNFKQSLLQAKTKYNEWVQVAKTNNVKDLVKEVPIKSDVSAFFTLNDKYYFQFDIKLNYQFKISMYKEKITYALIARTNEVHSWDNEFITCKDIVLVFTSSKEIQDFIDIFSLEKINAFRAKPKTEDLFK